MQQLSRSFRKQGPTTQLAWITREDGTVTQQRVRTRPGYEDSRWTVVDTGEDIYLQNSPDPSGPSMHETELEATQNAHDRIHRQISALMAKKGQLQNRITQLSPAPDPADYPELKRGRKPNAD